MRKLTRIHLDRFLARHASSERTLDIGAGGDVYAKYFPNRVTLDINPANSPDVVGDAHTLPFPDASFSSILCTELLEHVRHPDTVVGEMARVLAPGGTLVLTTRFVYPLHGVPRDYWRFTRYGLEALFEDWDIVELAPETREFETLAVLLQRIGFQSTMRPNWLGKLATYGLAASISLGNLLIIERFGDIERKKPLDHMMASGYHLVAKKRPQTA